MVLNLEKKGFRTEVSCRKFSFHFSLVTSQRSKLRPLRPSFPSNLSSFFLVSINHCTLIPTSTKPKNQKKKAHLHELSHSQTRSSPENRRMMSFSVALPESDQTDGFDRLPDPLILLIFNNISDIKTLIRCRAVSRRCNSLVPQSDSLSFKVDQVISDDEESFVVSFLRSIVKSLHDLISRKPLHIPARSQKSPAQILRGFERIKELEIELPSGDLRLEKGAVIRWKAEFGKTLKSCVILGFRGGGEAELGGGGLKMRVVWTISALIAASARHFMIKDVVKDHDEISKLVVKDREGEGTVVMNLDGLRECRGVKGGEDDDDVAAAEEEGRIGENGEWWRNNRTTVPAVRMRMTHEPKLKLSGGVRMDGATLVVVRPIFVGATEGVEDVMSGDAELAIGAFGGVYGEAVKELLKSQSYLLEMNSF